MFSLKDLEVPPKGSVVKYDPINLVPPFEHAGRISKTDEAKQIVYITGDNGTEVGRLLNQYELIKKPKNDRSKYPDKIASDSLDI